MKQIGILIIVSLFSLKLCAQSVETGTRIINSKEAEPKIVTSTKRIYKGVVQTWSDRTTNAKVYQRFKVAKADYAMSDLNWFTVCNWDGTEGVLPATASGCATYTEEADDADKGQWRVPTQRELALIWIFRETLGDGFAALDAGKIYCSATSAVSLDSFYYLKADGTIDADLKSSAKYVVRCIRDL